MTTAAAVLVVGELNVDVITSGPAPRFGHREQLLDDCRVTLGSSSAIFACGIRRLGHPVTMTGVVGKDAFGSVVLDALRDHRVHTSSVVVDPEVATGTTIVLDTGEDRALLTHLGSIGRTRREHVPGLAGFSHLHVGSVFLQRDLFDELPGLFDEARAAGLSISFDPNWDPDEEWTRLLPLFGHADVAFVNEGEAAALTGLPPEAAARELGGWMRPGGTSVVKRGAAGAVACRDGELHAVPVRRLEVVETTGAGDSFDAGFVHGLLTRRTLAGCLSAAVACGSLSTRAAGGTATQPDPAELAAWEAADD